MLFRALLVASVAAVVAKPSPSTNDVAVGHELIDTINAANPGWKAGVNENFAGWTVKQLRKLMGAKNTGPIKNLPKRIYDAETLAAVPASFDPRVTRANCTGPVLDQGFCGSCWAFGAVTAISDRYCMSSKGNGTFVQLSALDMTACADVDDGCDGGMLQDAWQYLVVGGLVTEKCYPYLKSAGGPVPTCAPTEQPCLPESKFIPTPTCNIPESCPMPVTINNVYSLDAAHLKAELVNKGPVESAFTVYADFPAYKSGVYSYTTGAELGGHAIKIIGYGTEGGVDYWLVQNSWTTTWGDGGYFKIRAGTDECGIEDSLIAGDF